MSEWLIPPIVALISGPLVWLLRRLDRNNTDQHANSMRVLERIETKVDGVKEDLKDHIEWHLDQQNH
jgi:uncharacterized membrane-anchored protein YhcB (DUF1043 family)